MKYVLMFCNTPELGDKVDAKDSEANYQEIFAWFDEHYSAGRIVDGGAELQPATTATTVRVPNGERIVTDGPFAETKEQLGGFYVVDCKDLDEAIDWASKIPTVKSGCVEVRPVIQYS